MLSLIKFLAEHRGTTINLRTLADLQLADFRAWLAQLARDEQEASSRARAVSGVRNFFRWADKEGVLYNQAIELLRLPKVPSNLPRPVSEDEALSITDLAAALPQNDWIGKRDRALFLLLYGCGLRISEALALTSSSFRLTDHLRILGKGKKERLVPLLPVVLDAVQEYQAALPFPRGDHEELFVGVRGLPLHPGIAQRTMRQIRDLQGLPDTTTPHALRHSYATHMLQNGADLRTLQELLGHSSLNTTQVYTKVDAVSLNKVYAAAHPRARSKK